MEAAVQGVFVLGLAAGAEGKVPHGGAGAVIGKVQEDGVPGAAVGAVDIGVEVPEALRVKELPEAFLADGQVRGDKGDGKALGGAFPDDEVPFLSSCFPGHHLHPFHPGRLRGLAHQGFLKGLQPLLRPGGLDQYPLGVV
jgi:hypothetical protein